MSLGSQTFINDGQRFTGPTSWAYQPTQYGPQTTGVPNVSPSMPPFVGAANGGGSSMGMGGYSDVDGYGTADNNAQVTAIANANPHNLKVSPVWWAVGSLLGGLFLLQVVHWRKTTLEGASESAHVGGARESASEAA